MSRSFRLIVVSLLVVFVFFANNACSANHANSITFSSFGGYYKFDSQQNFEDREVYGLGVGYNFDERWSTEATVSRLKTVGSDFGGRDVDVVQSRFDLLYHFLPAEALVPFIAVGIGYAKITPENFDSDNDLLFAYGGGVKYFLNDYVALRLEARHILDINDRDLQREDDLVHNLSLFAGLSFRLGGPQTPVVSPVDVDSDRDGVTDRLDQCPVTPHGTAVDKNGCPSSIKFVDSDGDGISDMWDACPETPTSIDVDSKGCSLVSGVDSDKDGVVDRFDQCPVTPHGTPVDQKGCPSTIKFIDSDGDGVSDVWDACPETPASAVVDSEGCLR